jgi:hypothetical protein
MLEFFLVTLTLWSFAVLQPILDLLSKTPEFLVIRRSSSIEISVMVLLVALVVPLCVSFIRAALRLCISTRWFDNSIFFILSSLFGLLLSNSFYRAPCIGLIFTFALIKWSGVRSFFRFLSISPVVFTALFVFSISNDVIAPRARTTIEKGIVDATKARPTFVIIFDEFPLFILMNNKQEINATRFPGFAKLSKHTTWFRNASVLTSWTERAVPSVLSGMAPNVSKTQMPSIIDYPQNIFTLFAGTHKVEGFEQVTSLCPPTICADVTEKDPFMTRMQILIEDLSVIYLHRVLPTDLKDELPSIEGKFEGFIEHHEDEKTKKKSHHGLVIKDDRGDDVSFFNLYLKHIQREVPRLQKNGVAPLYVIHITFPHVPYRYLPDGRKYFLDRDSNNDREFVTKWAPDAQGVSDLFMQRLAMQAGVADSLINDFVDTLKALGILESSSIVVTADHGSSFTPGEPSRAVTQNNSVDIMSVPLFVSLPSAHRESEVSDANVWSIDILPTLLELNGITPAIPLEGNSLLHPERFEARSHKIFFPLQGSKEQLSFSSPLDHAPSVKRYTTLFGEGGFDQRFYSPHIKFHELLGKTVQPKAPFNDSTLGVAIHGHEKYAKITLSSSYHRSAVSGFVRARTGQKIDEKRYYVAITIDNVIVAIAQTEITKKGHADFLAIVPPSLIKEGKNLIGGIVLRE